MEIRNPQQEVLGEDGLLEWISPVVSELPMAELTQGSLSGNGGDSGVYS